MSNRRCLRWQQLDPRCQGLCLVVFVNEQRLHELVFNPNDAPFTETVKSVANELLDFNEPMKNDFRLREKLGKKLFEIRLWVYNSIVIFLINQHHRRHPSLFFIKMGSALEHSSFKDLKIFYDWLQDDTIPLCWCQILAKITMSVRGSWHRT